MSTPCVIRRTCQGKVATIIIVVYVDDLLYIVERDKA